MNLADENMQPQLAPEVVSVNAGIAFIAETPNSRYVEFFSEEDWKLFQQLVNRAMNCWDRAPAKLKVFGDMVTEGKVLQNYTDLGSEVKTD